MQLATGAGSALLASGLLLCSVNGIAAESAPASFSEALAKTKPLLDLRLRQEGVDQDGLPEKAEALTLRARIGIETGKFANTAFLVEGEFLAPLDNDYRPDPTIATMTAYPVVADEEARELNRLQLTNTSLPGTTITLGRQRINLDDQRFVGNVGWRMNEQTFDALRVVNKSVANLTIDVTYLDQVNRVFGKTSPQGRYEGDTFLGNVAWQLKPGKLTGFAYLVDIGPVPGVAAAVRDSSATYGLRFAGEQPLGRTRLTYAASYATQKDYADNPLTFDLDYYLVEVGAVAGKFTVGAGYEVLEGDGARGFATPLATLHKFQGWADKYLTTPPNGIEDLYFSAGWGTKGVGPFETLSLVAAWHDYGAQRISQSYGSELNLQVQAKIRKITGLIKYADYRAERLFTDTRKLWFQLELAL